MLKALSCQALITPVLLFLHCQDLSFDTADIIFINGSIITVDSGFTVHQALAVKDNRILAVGDKSTVKKMAGAKTMIIDLRGKNVLPGLIEGHNHMLRASCNTMEHQNGKFVEKTIPPMHTIEEVLAYVKSEAERLPPGTWIEVSKVFPTRLKERRMPIKAELDKAAPRHPVVYNASYAMVLNSMALKRCGIGPNPTGLVRRRRDVLEKGGFGRNLNKQDRLEALRRMQKVYIKNGFTSAFLRGCPVEDISVIRTLDSLGELDIRFNITHVLPVSRLIAENDRKKIRANISKYIDSLESLRQLNNQRIKFNTLKIHTDGGILTGTALMRRPWGLQKIFQIDDPQYHGNQPTPMEVIGLIVDEANRRNWQFTAHATGDSGVQLLFNAYESTHKNVNDISKRRFQVTHGDFFGKDQMAQAKKMGIVLDAQWPWLYLDGPLMKDIMDEDRIKDFMPFGAWVRMGLVVGGGSDHMIGFHAKDAINPFHPFLGLWVMSTGMMCNGKSLGPEHKTDRREALRIYTINNAFMGFNEDINGSIEKGKLADLIVISGDYLNCAVNEIKNIEVVMTIIDGKIVYQERK